MNPKRNQVVGERVKRKKKQLAATRLEPRAFRSKSEYLTNRATAIYLFDKGLLRYITQNIGMCNITEIIRTMFVPVLRAGHTEHNPVQLYPRMSYALVRTSTNPHDYTHECRTHYYESMARHFVFYTLHLTCVHINRRLPYRI